MEQKEPADVVEEERLPVPFGQCWILFGGRYAAAALLSDMEDLQRHKRTKLI